MSFILGGITLRNPQIGDSKTVDTQGSLLRSVAQELISISKAWPVNVVQNLVFTGLKDATTASLITYINAHMHEPIAVTDHEGGSYNILITSPEAKRMVVGRSEYNSVEFEFVRLT